MQFSFEPATRQTQSGSTEARIQAIQSHSCTQWTSLHILGSASSCANTLGSLLRARWETDADYGKQIRQVKRAGATPVRRNS